MLNTIERARQDIRNWQTPRNERAHRHVWFVVWVPETGECTVASQSDMRAGAFEEWEVIETHGEMQSCCANTH